MIDLYKEMHEWEHWGEWISEGSPRKLVEDIYMYTQKDKWMKHDLSEYQNFHLDTFHRPMPIKELFELEQQLQYQDELREKGIIDESLY